MYFINTSEYRDNHCYSFLQLFLLMSKALHRCYKLAEISIFKTLGISQRSRESGRNGDGIYQNEIPAQQSIPSAKEITDKLVMLQKEVGSIKVEINSSKKAINELKNGFSNIYDVHLAEKRQIVEIENLLYELNDICHASVLEIYSLFNEIKRYNNDVHKIN